MDELGANALDNPALGSETNVTNAIMSSSTMKLDAVRDPATDTIGLVFQFFHLLPHLGVLENVLLPCWIAGERGTAPEERAMDLLARVSLADRARDPVQKLSGGEMQRVALCRALVRKPALVLPTTRPETSTTRTAGS